MSSFENYHVDVSDERKRFGAQRFSHIKKFFQLVNRPSRQYDITEKRARST